MKKKTTKIISVILSVLLIFSVMPMTVLASDSVASVTTITGDVTEFSSLEEAIDFASANVASTLTLLSDAEVVDKEFHIIDCDFTLDLNGKTFKVEAKRADKRFPLTSVELCIDVGGYLDDKIEGITCDVHNPDVTVKIEVRDYNAFVYCSENKLSGQGGMPIGTGSKATLLLSGGIDSPVAGHMMAKRGIEIDAINFFSFPYTSERAKEKVIELASILAKYTSKIDLYIVPFTEIQLAIRDNCPQEHMTLIMRRFMMKLSEKIAYKNGSAALITGESAGQVASQTLAALNVTNSVVKMPVLRPLIGMDKKEIVERSHDIGTFETSILPYEDCCTVFTPKHPTTNPKLAVIEKSEARLDADTLIEKALEGVEKITVYPKM